jgi:hypothetical protein
VLGGGEGVREIGQPVGIGIRVVVDVGDDLAGGGDHACIARAAEPAVGRADETKTVGTDDGGRVVGGAVVHDHDFEVRVLEAE